MTHLVISTVISLMEGKFPGLLLFVLGVSQQDLLPMHFHDRLEVISQLSFVERSSPDHDFDAISHEDMQ